MAPGAPQLKSSPKIDFQAHPALRKNIKRFPSGQYLFRQAEPGNTMFLILDGIVWLLGDKDGESHVAGVLEKGQFIGEKAALGNAHHQRFFSALAKTTVTAIELTLSDLDHIEKESPELMIHILRGVFSVAAERLDRSNHLIRVLRSSDNVKRLIELILYFSESQGRKVPEGVEFPLNEDSIHYHVDMQKEEIDSCLDELVAKKALRRSTNHYYILKNEKLLRDAVAPLRIFLAKLRARRSLTPPSILKKLGF